MKILITAPVYVNNLEHLKYLNLTTESFYSKDHDIYFAPVENFVADSFKPLAYRFVSEPDETYIIKSDLNCVSRAWNLGIKKGAEIGADYVLVINTDIVFKSNMVDRLVAFAESHQDAIVWTASEWSDLGGLEEALEDEGFSEHPHFSCFMVKPSILDTVGTFDENFIPAYCEDGDYHYRIVLSGNKGYIYGGARFFHFGSRIIKSDLDAWNANTKTFAMNQAYFLKKWGHPVVGDVERMKYLYYLRPFNDESKTYKDWGEWE